MKESSLERLQSELGKKRRPTATAAGFMRPAPPRRSKRQAFELSRMSFAHNAAAVAGVGSTLAKLGESVIKTSIDKSDGDIHFSLEAMEGTFHPKYPKWSDRERELYAASPFTRKEVTFRGPVVKNTFGVEVYAELMLQYQTNGYLVGEVLASPGKRNDPPGFGLDVAGKIVRNQNATGDVAEIAYQVMYTFTRTMGQDAVWYGELRIRGDGSLTQTRGEWVQFRTFPSPFSLARPDQADTDRRNLKFKEASPPFPKWLHDRECAPSQARALEDSDNADGGEEQDPQTADYETHEFDSSGGQRDSGEVGGAVGDEAETGGDFALSQAVTPWATFFPFAAGSKYEVDGPGPYNGKGQVYTRTDTVLKFDLDMPEKDVPLFGKVPKSHMIFECTYRAEGRGNLVKATVNGTPFVDEDATITTTAKRRTVKPSIKVKDEKGVDQAIALAVEADGARSIQLDLTLGDRTFDFDLDLA